REDMEVRSGECGTRSGNKTGVRSQESEDKGSGCKLSYLTPASCAYVSLIEERRDYKRARRNDLVLTGSVAGLGSQGQGANVVGSLVQGSLSAAATDPPRDGGSSKTAITTIRRFVMTAIDSGRVSEAFLRSVGRSRLETHATGKPVCVAVSREAGSRGS